jgi:TetR/AcrR family transcriptional regulator
MPATASSERSKGRVRRVNEARILRAAERVFADSGFAGARMAEIAAAAGVPKANLHYYFRSKRAIYRAVLDNILALWLAETAAITETAEPGAALAQYIRAKMRFSRRYPDASRVFANEIIHGAQEIGFFLRGDMKALIDQVVALVLRGCAIDLASAKTGER